MQAKILSGKEVSSSIKEELKERVAMLKEKGIVPGLATVLVGEDAASLVYVRNKHKACESLGIRSVGHHLPADAKTEQVLKLVEDLNEDQSIHGILVQLPLPPQIDQDRVLEAVLPSKDVDGFHPQNVGRFFSKKSFSQMQDLLIPCTPHGIIKLLEYYDFDFTGKNAVVIGRSNIVGKPLSLLLLSKNATVTVCHTKTASLSSVTREADLLVAAIGRARFVKADMVKEGAWVVDVGVNRVPEGLCGDVDFEQVSKKVEAITPVPGGIGPMTICMLLYNTVRVAEWGS